MLPKTTEDIKKLIQKGQKLPLATKNYPSRGQTAIQELYETTIGKIFVKSASKQNHVNCQIDPANGTLAQREFWAYQLAIALELNVPELHLLDSMTTVQIWLDYPDAHQFATDQGPLAYNARNIFECALFDWLTGQVDRHDANYLYDYVNERIILIDSANSFLRYEGSLPDYLRVFEVAYAPELDKKHRSNVHDKILRLSHKRVDSLVPLRNEEERMALYKRKEQLKEVKTLRDILKLYRSQKT